MASCLCVFSKSREPWVALGQGPRIPSCTQSLEASSSRKPSFLLLQAPRELSRPERQTALLRTFPTKEPLVHENPRGPAQSMFFLNTGLHGAITLWVPVGRVSVSACKGEGTRSWVCPAEFPPPGAAARLGRQLEAAGSAADERGSPSACGELTFSRRRGRTQTREGLSEGLHTW